MGQDMGFSWENGQDSSCHILLQAGLSVEHRTAHETTVTWLCWKITLLRNSHYFGFCCYTRDIPRVLGQWWLPQRGRRQRSQTCFQPEPWLQAEDSAASPCAVAATSLLNYINRPPSSVIFYYLGKKKWAGRAKMCILSQRTPAREAVTEAAKKHFCGARWKVLCQVKIPKV